MLGIWGPLRAAEGEGEMISVLIIAMLIMGMALVIGACQGWVSLGLDRVHIRRE